MIEVAAAVVLLAAAIVLTLKLLVWTTIARQAAQQQSWARQEVANVMETLSLEPWEQVTPERASQLQLSAEAIRVLPEGQLTAEVTPAEGDRRGKRIVLQLRWRDRSGQWTAPVHLAAWIYQRETSP